MAASSAGAEVISVSRFLRFCRSDSRAPPNVPRVFRGGKKGSRSRPSVRGQGKSLSGPHVLRVEACVCIYRPLWGLWAHASPLFHSGHRRFLLHPEPIREHKELFDSLHTPDMTNNRIVYSLIPVGTAQRTGAALCYVCNDLYRPSLTKCEFARTCARSPGSRPGASGARGELERARGTGFIWSGWLLVQGF